VGEEAEVDGDVKQRCGIDVSAVGVDHVGDRLEREEADPDREGDREQRKRDPQRDRIQRTVDVLDEEGVVLEDPERRQVERDDGGEELLLPPLGLRACDEAREEPVSERDPAEQEAELPVRVAVEDVARYDDEDFPPCELGHKDP
jgi:hypothetical protein